MRYLIGILLLLSVASCNVQRWCAEKYPVVADTLYFEVIRDSIVYRDTLVTVYITSETVADTVFLPCPPGFVSDTAVAMSSFATARAWFSHPNLILELHQKDSLLTFKFDSLITEAYYWRDKYEQITAIQEVVRIPILYRVALWMLVGMLVLIIFFVVLKRL